MSRNTAMSRLQDACRKNGPLCIGLDTDPSYLPESVIAKYPSKEEAVLAYNKGIVDAASQYAGCYKVQIAYYEAMGLKGMEVFAKTVQYIRSKNIPVISDVKRGDIADTAKAYAKAHFQGDFETDIITINPYMGFDTLEPFMSFFPEKGAFVLLRTSNPGMQDIENQPLSNGKPVLSLVGDKLNQLAAEYASSNPGECSPFGAVVGCTEEEDARKIRDMYPDVFFLIPGFGAQGGKARIAATLLDKAGGAVNSSRGILTAWKKDEDLTAKREAGTLTMEDIVASATKAAKESTEVLLEAKNSL
ncbi:MAG: orotidine-5'-phosphate decarboxylase [Spirochaetaceae bacterium]|nr:orotidine-5'-phosphate decarboxylase [Spirochaetaceae bacterium]